MGVSLLVVFLYGSIVWGILPIDWSVSFEGHFYGALSGSFLAYYYRNQGPQRKTYYWENEDFIEEDEKDDSMKIVCEYKPSENHKKENQK